MAKGNNRRARRLLEQAAPHVGHDVIVIAPGVNGQGYIATSLPLKTSVDVQHIIRNTTEALKRMRRWERQRRRDEAKQLADKLGDAA